jgi:hypothetical protein
VIPVLFVCDVGELGGFAVDDPECRGGSSSSDVFLPSMIGARSFFLEEEAFERLGSFAVSLS